MQSHLKAGLTLRGLLGWVGGVLGFGDVVVVFFFWDLTELIQIGQSETNWDKSQPPEFPQLTPPPLVHPPTKQLNRVCGPVAKTARCQRVNGGSIPPNRICKI